MSNIEQRIILSGVVDSAALHSDNGPYNDNGTLQQGVVDSYNDTWERGDAVGASSDNAGAYYGASSDNTGAAAALASSLLVAADPGPLFPGPLPGSMVAPNNFSALLSGGLSGGQSTADHHGSFSSSLKIEAKEFVPAAIAPQEFVPSLDQPPTGTIALASFSTLWGEEQSFEQDRVDASERDENVLDRFCAQIQERGIQERSSSPAESTTPAGDLDPQSTAVVDSGSRNSPDPRTGELSREPAMNAGASDAGSELDP